MRIQVCVLVLIVSLSDYPDNVDTQTVVYPIVFRSRTKNLYEKRYQWPQPGTELHIDVTCLEPFSPLLLPGNKTLSGISIENCRVPKTPLAEQFRNSLINYKDLYKLQFTNTFMETPFPSDFTAGLSVKELEIWNLTNFQVSLDFFTSLSELRVLTVGKMEVPTLPPSELLRLETLILKHSPVNKWDNCNYLRELAIEGLNYEQIPKEWPGNCSHLETLRLESVTNETIEHISKSFNAVSLVNIKNLVVTNCALVGLPLFLMQSQIIENIDLSNNNLDSKAFLQFPSKKTLKVLMLSNNEGIWNEALITVLPRLPGLRELKLNGVGLYGGLDSLEFRLALTKLNSLESLNLDRRLAKENTFFHNHFSSLSYLSMKYNNPRYSIDHLWLHGFPSTGARQLEVDMSSTPVKYVSIGPKFVENFEYIYESRKSLWITNKGYKLIVKLGSVDCDCNNDVLARVLREFPHFLAMPDLKCSHGGLFKDEPIENLSCRKATVNGCVRKMSREADYTTVVDCSNNSKKFLWPQPQGLRVLNASNNSITSLDKAYLPESLEWLDLRHNKLSRLNGKQSARLFGDKGRRVWLAGNPIICDCDNQPLLDMLHATQSLVQDYDILTCADSGKLLRLVSVPELCRPRSMIILSTISILALLVLVVALLTRHYWSSLRMILYAHGFCLSCLREEDIDEDRPYDAFLSFAHGDDQYVMEQLLPQLEGEPNFYRICVHYRDWAVGDWIPSQIMKSVRVSKRTIIVLSKNFVQSCWGVLEFRHAHAGAMADGRQRLLVLILDDVLSENLTPELQAYLELNTYLKCSDPWFWEKLRYAMPHKSKKQTVININAGVNVSPQHNFIPPSTERETLAMQVIYS